MNRQYYPPRRLVLAVLLLIAVSCAPVNVREASGDATEQIAQLQEKLRADSRDADALRDLGALYFQTKAYDKAATLLEMAMRERPDDPKTMFYRGLSLEFDGKEEEARKLFARHSDVSSFSPYRKLLRGRYEWLNREAARKQARLLINDPLKAPAAGPNSVAVFPMLFQGDDEQYAALGRGLSEMLTVDLGQIDRLTVIERIRTQELIRELEFANSKYVDPASSPRPGKLLGANLIVGGVYDVNGSELAVNASSWDLAKSQNPNIHDKQDQLQNLFILEKDLLVDIIGRLGITLSREERTRLLSVPTRNISAFLQYCLGLEKEDAREFDLAGEYFANALRIDPGFGLAASARDRSGALEATGGTIEQAVQGAVQATGGGAGSSSSGQQGMRNGRMQSLGDNIGAGFLNGEDARRGLEEAVDAGAGVGELPEPPPPDGQPPQ